MKVVYNFSNTKNKDYATLPTYGKYAFIESMDVNPSGLRKLAIDRFERIAVPQQTPDQEKYAQPNPFTNGMPSGVGEPVSDDIPF